MQRATLPAFPPSLARSFPFSHLHPGLVSGVTSVPSTRAPLCNLCITSKPLTTCPPSAPLPHSGLFMSPPYNLTTICPALSRLLPDQLKVPLTPRDPPISGPGLALNSSQFSPGLLRLLLGQFSPRFCPAQGSAQAGPCTHPKAPPSCPRVPPRSV